jgi:hypothetical protein
VQKQNYSHDTASVKPPANIFWETMGTSLFTGLSLLLFSIDSKRQQTYYETVHNFT